VQDNNTASPQPTQSLPLILIIEDDFTLAKMYSEKFKSEGFEVLIARDGQEGLRLVSERKPGFVLLDMMLPKTSGQEVLNQLKNSTNEGLQIIALTNLARKDEAQKALELGAKEYLIKAMYTPEEVVQKVKQYLGIS
jgi:DNA-binding response OmpR family regulator